MLNRVEFTIALVLGWIEIRCLPLQSIGQLLGYGAQLILGRLWLRLLGASHAILNALQKQVQYVALIILNSAIELGGEERVLGIQAQILLRSLLLVKIDGAGQIWIVFTHHFVHVFVYLLLYLLLIDGLVLVRLVTEHLALLDLDPACANSTLIVIIKVVVDWWLPLVLNINLVLQVRLWNMLSLLALKRAISKTIGAWYTSFISIPSLPLVVDWLLLSLGLEALSQAIWTS